MSVSVAVVGATGAVGDLMRTVLLERNFPAGTIKFLASERSAGKTIEFAGKRYIVEAHPPGGLRRRPDRPVQHAVEDQQGISAPSRPNRGPSSSTTRPPGAWTRTCPLVVPEVNADELKNIQKGIVANPNCVAIPLCVALKPLHDIAEIKRVIVSTYQSSSGKGATGLRGLRRSSSARG